MAATRRNVKSMIKSRKIQSRKPRAFMVDAQSFGGPSTAAKKRAPKKKNFELARKVMDNYCLPE